uniref:Putative ovule protein n=1 Tax=Solanum chacoense TaxID=4108 RepID=A0A0V0ITP6_SOLCH
MLIVKLKVLQMMRHKDSARSNFLLQIQDRIFFSTFLPRQLGSMLHIDQYQIERLFSPVIFLHIFHGQFKSVHQQKIFHHYHAYGRANVTRLVLDLNPFQ